MNPTSTPGGLATAIARADDSGRLPSLLVRYQQGEAAAVEELVRSLSPAMWRYFASFPVNPGDVEDLIQDCWLRIHRARHTYRAPEPVLPWIFAIARHTRLDDYRKRRRRQFKEVLAAEPPDAGYCPPADSESPQRFKELVDQLPESQREVIVMLKETGMTIDEAARATASTTGAVKQKAHRAYTRLRELIQAREKQR